MARLGTGLLVLGLLALAYGALWQLGIAPGSRVTLPPPVALEHATPTAVPTAPVVLAPPALVSPTATVALSRAPLIAADVADRTQIRRLETGYAVRLAI